MLAMKKVKNIDLTYVVLAYKRLALNKLYQSYHGKHGFPNIKINSLLKDLNVFIFLRHKIQCFIVFNQIIFFIYLYKYALR